jgi:hypothetical protein
MIEERSYEKKFTVPKPVGYKEKSLKDKVDEIYERFQQFDESKSKKKYKLPLSQRIGAAGKIKKGYILVFLLTTNGTINPKFLPVEKDIIYLKKNRTFHIASSNYMWRYGKYPAIILNEYNLEPLNPKEMYEQALKDKKIAWNEEFLVYLMEQMQLKKKTSFGGWTIIIIAVAALAGLYFLTQLLE